MRATGRAFAAAAFFAAAFGFAGLAHADVVVLKGGTVVPLKQPWVRRGNTAYLTRADGTLLSVPVTEIDPQATAAANQAAASAAPAPAEASPASTPAEAARQAADATKPKASVRITDADVSHPMELESAEAPKGEQAAAGGAVAGARVEVADYTQEMRADTLIIKGSLRNIGQAPAESLRLNIAAIDEKGQPIEGTTASLSKGTIGSGQSVEFTAQINVGQKTVATLRFHPQWAPPKPPPPTPGPAAPAAASGAAAAPSPRPTPYGRGSMWVAPVPNAPSQPPADGKTGYIPGATHPDNQPKPPSR